jgi:hypothetical protein
LALLLTMKILEKKINIEEMFTPFSNMEDARAAHDDGVQLVAHAALRHLLQAPVPVVVVVVTKPLCALPDLLPHGAIKGHAHVVLAAHPRRQFRLQTNS